MLSSARTPLAAADENSLVARSGMGAGGAAAKGTTTAKRTGVAAAAPAAGMSAVDPTQISKTPRTHGMKTRRALGDISNRKGTTTSTANDITITTAKDNSGSISRRRAATTGIKKPVLSVSTAAHPTKTPVVVVARAPAKAVSFAMDVDNEPNDDDPDRVRALKAPKTPHVVKLLKQQQQQQRPSSHDRNHPPRMEFDFDEDVEMPAGRLWIDQPWNHNDDDDGSWDMSLEGAATAREDLMEDLERRHRLRIEMSQRDDEMALQAVQDDVETLLRSAELLRFTPPSPASSIASFSHDDLADVWASQELDDDSIGEPLDISF